MPLANANSFAIRLPSAGNYIKLAISKARWHSAQFLPQAATVCRPGLPSRRRLSRGDPAVGAAGDGKIRRQLPGAVDMVGLVMVAAGINLLT
ncbi:hypothetical protein KCP75_22310 [Salmonella enterica subsp. enterica]|nr:hypothetical protein KCP75_22310 [Salmonella enterica subsp. enterica]